MSPIISFTREDAARVGEILCSWSEWSMFFVRDGRCIADEGGATMFLLIPALERISITMARVDSVNSRRELAEAHSIITRAIAVSIGTSMMSVDSDLEEYDA